MVAQVDADVAHFLTMTSQEKIHRNQFRPGRFYARCSAMPIIRNANFDTKDSRFLPGLGGKDEFFGWFGEKSSRKRDLFTCFDQNIRLFNKLPCDDIKYINNKQSVAAMLF